MFVIDNWPGTWTLLWLPCKPSYYLLDHCHFSNFKHWEVFDYILNFLKFLFSNIHTLKVFYGSDRSRSCGENKKPAVVIHFSMPWFFVSFCCLRKFWYFFFLEIVRVLSVAIMSCAKLVFFFFTNNVWLFFFFGLKP